MDIYDLSTKETTMNLYECVSEQLMEHVPILDDGTGPDEPYAIVELIAAKSPSAAKWAAWKSDRNSFTADVRDMPHFRLRCVAKNVVLSAGIHARAFGAWLDENSEKYEEESEDKSVLCWPGPAIIEWLATLRK